MRRRLVLAIAGVAAASVVLFALPLALSIQQHQRDEELLRLQRDTVAATREIDVGTDRGDPVELPRTGDRITVYDRKGRPVAGRKAAADRLTASALRNARPATSSRDGQLTVAAPLLHGEQLTGVVRAQRGDGSVGGAVRRAWLGVLAVALAVIVLAVVAALLLGRRMAAPLERLAVAARRLGQGDFASRAPRARIEELDAVAEALDATAQRLGELLARERAFSADASHQLRTPLAALRLELEALELRGPPAPEVVAALAQVERLQSTIDALLSVARGTPRREQVTSLAASADALEHRWRGPLADTGRALHVRIEPGCPPAAASPPVIEEVLEVLLDNAHRHGGGRVTVSVTAAPGWVTVEVADEGPGLGMAPEHAFTRRSDGSGHGIGLALARSLAAAEQGDLTVRDDPSGPAFTLRLRAATSGPAP